MDKKFAQNAGIVPLSNTATTGVNSDIFVLTAIAIPYYPKPCARHLQRVYTKSMSKASKRSPNLPRDTVFQ